MKTVLQIRNVALVAVILSMIIGVAVIADDEPEETAEPTLYERLGGVYSIASVVDELVDRLDKNELLNANPMIAKARSEVPIAGIKFRLTAMVCQAAGGPEVYHGRSMKDAHAHLNISNAEWVEMVRVFSELLDEFKVPEKEKGELFALIGPTKADIVTAE